MHNRVGRLDKLFNEHVPKKKMENQVDSVWRNFWNDNKLVSEKKSLDFLLTGWMDGWDGRWIDY